MHQKTIDTLPPCHHDGAINKAALLLETGTHGSRIKRAQGQLKSRETVAAYIDSVRRCLGRPARLPAFLAKLQNPPTRSGWYPEVAKSPQLLQQYPVCRKVQRTWECGLVQKDTFRNSVVSLFSTAGTRGNSTRKQLPRPSSLETLISAP